MVEGSESNRNIFFALGSYSSSASSGAVETLTRLRRYVDPLQEPFHNVVFPYAAKLYNPHLTPSLFTAHDAALIESLVSSSTVQLH